MSEPGTEAYGASKGGLLALTHALAMSPPGAGQRLQPRLDRGVGLQKLLPPNFVVDGGMPKRILYV